MNNDDFLATLEIEYRDGKGKTSKRIIDIEDFSAISAVGYLTAYCRLKKSIRTFDLDRIERCIDVKTGESIPHLANYFNKLYFEKYGKHPNIASSLKPFSKNNE